MADRILCCVLGCFLLVGCATSSLLDPSEAPEYIIIRDFTPFYRIGPQQVRGPDVTLKVNERLLLLRKEFGYSFVQLEGGQTGYVPNESLAVAPPRPKPTPAPQTVRSNSGRSSSASSSPPRRSYPDFSTDDIPQPDFTLPVEEELMDLPADAPLVQPSPSPEPTARPKFRF